MFDAYREQQAGLQEAHAGGEAQLNDRVFEQRASQLTHPVRSAQPLRCTSHLQLSMQIT